MLGLVSVAVRDAVYGFALKVSDAHTATAVWDLYRVLMYSGAPDAEPTSTPPGT